MGRFDLDVIDNITCLPRLVQHIITEGPCLEDHVFDAVDEKRHELEKRYDSIKDPLHRLRMQYAYQCLRTVQWCAHRVRKPVKDMLPLHMQVSAIADKTLLSWDDYLDINLHLFGLIARHGDVSGVLPQDWENARQCLYIFLNECGIAGVREKNDRTPEIKTLVELTT